MLRNVALMVLVDSEKRILLQLRDEKAPTFPLHWGFFGGALEKNETPVEAIKREIKEELSIDVENPKLALKIGYKTKTRRGQKYYFMIDIKDKSKLVQREGKDMRWFNLNDLTSLKTAKHNTFIFEKLKEII